MVSLDSTAHRVSVIIFFTIAQISTIARIWIRYRKQRLWWDDGWVFLTMLLSILMDFWLFVGGPNQLSPHTQIVRYWLEMISFTVAVWCARISLMLAVVRLIPPLFTLRKISEWAAVSFSLMCVAILMPKIHTCASDRSWYHTPIPQCALGLRNPNIAIGELITDLVADITLVVLPIRLLGHVNLSKDKRRMLVVIFGASLLTSAVSVVHVVFLMGFSHYYTIVPITAEVEVGTALTVANLGVLTPFLYRLIGKRDGDIDSKPYTRYPSVQTNGDIRMRRVSDLVASGIRVTDTSRVSTSVRAQEPESERKQELCSNLDISHPDGTDSYEIPKTELLRGNSL